ncbi:hypothetical protein TNCV_660961 [Trichonephila clavipes]|nr:hypothetical protein TNCV_660961 [Trichonephila clavipes]
MKVNRDDQDLYPIAYPNIPPGLVQYEDDSTNVRVIDHTFENPPVCDTASSVATAMFSELRIHAYANVVELFVQTHIVLQTTPIHDSELKTWLHDSLRFE